MIEALADEDWGTGGIDGEHAYDVGAGGEAGDGAGEAVGGAAEHAQEVIPVNAGGEGGGMTAPSTWRRI